LLQRSSADIQQVFTVPSEIWIDRRPLNNVPLDSLLNENLMDLKRMIFELHTEREQINETLLVLEHLAVATANARGRPQKWLSEIKNGAARSAAATSQRISGGRFVISSVLERGAINTALVVDYDPSVRSTVRSILSVVGFDVVECNHGRHALAILQTSPGFDLLVTQTCPPEVDGRTLTESFMLKCPLGRTILLSEHLDTAAINNESNGAWTVIAKQYLSDVFLDALKSIGFGHPHRVILVVDNEPVVRKFVRFILVKAGYDVIDAGDGQEALELSRAYRGTIDLVVCDMTMPRMAGPELAEHIQHERPNTHVLLMSGYASGMFREYATSQNFFQKPFIPKKLTDKVAELLNRTNASGAVAEM
jgi:CheY-like chemotaxis protein